MKIRKIEIVSIVFFILTLIIMRVFKEFPHLAYDIYTTNINRFIRISLSKLSSLSPISIGEAIVITVILGSIVVFISLIVNLLKFNFQNIVIIFRNIFAGIILIYSIFMFLWGFNYISLDMYEIEGYEKTDYEIEDLLRLSDFLIEEANKLRTEIDSESRVDKTKIINLLNDDYVNLINGYPMLSGDYGKPKYILTSEIFSYTGIVGVYFPFTGEANINKNEIDFMLPATILHEMAHQRGIAREDEANYLAFILSRRSNDIDVRYSGTLLGLIKSMNAIYDYDKEMHKDMKEKLNELVIDDFETINEHWDKYSGKAEEVADKFNDSYLKLNGQREGVLSYDLMIGLLIKWFGNGMN